MGTLLPKHMAPDLSGFLARDKISPAGLRQHKLVLAIAGPGYGKTVAAAQAARAAGIDQVWFRPGSERAGPDHFLESFSQGILSHYPGWEFPRGGEARPAARIARWLDRLDGLLDRPLCLVVDDCHTLGPDLIFFFQAALDRHSPRLHLILAGRSVPDLKLSRLTAEHQVLRISEAELAFSLKEIEVLLEARYGMGACKDMAAVLWEKTRGWPAGLALFCQGLGPSQEGEPVAAVAALKGSHWLVSDYIKENTYDHLSREDQVFLLKVAILNPLDEDACAEFTGIANARQRLRSLEDRRCFVFSCDADRTRFQMHPLFQDFLTDRITEELGPGQLTRLYADAARMYERQNQGKEALVYYVRAGCKRDAARMVNRFARPILKQDRPHMLKSLLSVVPAHYMDDEPWFQYLQAGYYGVCRQLQMAVKAYEKVLASFRVQEDVHGECMVLMELAEHYLSTGDIKGAEQAYTRILVKDHLDAYLTIIVMGYMIRVLALQGRTGDADRYARKAMALLGELDNQTDLDMGRAWIYVAQGYRYAFSGGYARAMKLGEDAKALFESLGEVRFLLSAYFLIAYTSFYLGQFARGRDSAQEGIETALKNGIEDEFSEFLVLLRAKNCLELPDLSEAEIDEILVPCKKSLASFRTGGFAGGVAQGCLVLHRAYLRKREIGRAEESLRRGMAAIRGNDLPLVKNELQVALSGLLLFCKSPPQKREAFVLLKDAEQALLSSGWHISWISRIFTRYYWEYGHRETAYKYMVHSLKVAEEEGFDAWVCKETDWIIPVLVSMAVQGSMKTYLFRLFRQMDSRILPALADLDHRGTPAVRKVVAQFRAMVPRPEPLPLHVCFFDRFRLFVGDRQVLPEQWRSLKALTLCKYMLALGHDRFLERDILMELLWPDDDPKLSAQRFHVAMASIRKTLEPDIAKGTRSSYIRRSGQAYRIHIQDKGSADIQTFSKLVAAVKKEPEINGASRLCQDAALLYKGPFLREDPFESWCVPVREKYRQMYLWVLMQMLHHHEAKGEWGRCVHTATACLEEDPLDETMIQRLMQYHARNGNRVMASRLYAGFKQRVKEELDCGVSGETTRLNEHLVSGR